MNSTLLVLLIGCGLLQQAIADSPLKSSDDTEKSPLKYYSSSGGSYSHTPEYLSSAPSFGSAFSSPDYYICRKTLLNSFEPVDLFYSNSPPNRVSLRRSVFWMRNVRDPQGGCVDPASRPSDPITDSISFLLFFPPIRKTTPDPIV